MAEHRIEDFQDEDMFDEALDRALPAARTVGSAGTVGCVCGTAGTVSTAGSFMDRQD